MSENIQTENRNTQVRKKSRFSIRLVNGSDLWIHLAMIFLMIFGLVMIGSASMGLAVGNNGYLVKTVGKQAAFLILGYIIMTYLSRKFTLDFLKSSKFFALIVGMEILLLACLGFRGTNGAHAWIRIPFPGIDVSLQPSEFAKIVTMLIVAGYTGDITKHFKRKRDLLLRPLLFIGVYVFTVAILQSDFGSAMVIFIIACVCFLIPSNPQMHGFQLFLKGAFWFVVVAAVFILSPSGSKFVESMPLLHAYQKKRFESAINPFQDQYGSGYQLVNGLVSFATGGWFGKGFGNSIRKYTDFPEANTDFILAIVVEELGFVGFLVLMAAYCVIIFRLLAYAMKIHNERAKIILTGTAIYFLVHIFVNIGGVTGLIPLTGIPLLMISSGGSSTLSIMMCVGICQAVIGQYRRGEIQ